MWLYMFAAAVIDGVRYKDLRAVTSVVASGQYKADQDSEGASEDDIVVYTGAFGQGDGGAAAYTGVYWQGKGVHRHIHLCL
jgi:hypothetical protein